MSLELNNLKTKFPYIKTNLMNYLFAVWIMRDPKYTFAEPQKHIIYVALTKLIKWAPETEGNQLFWPNSKHASSDKSLAPTNCNPPPPVCVWAENVAPVWCPHISIHPQRRAIFCVRKRQPIKMVRRTRESARASNLIMRPQRDIRICENRPEAASVI